MPEPIAFLNKAHLLINWSATAIASADSAGADRYRVTGPHCRFEPLDLVPHGYLSLSQRQTNVFQKNTFIDPKAHIVEGKTLCLVSCQRSPEPVYL